jgi:hypothetical protein
MTGLRVKIPTAADVKSLMAGLRGDVAKATTGGMQDAVDGFKAEIRGQVRANFRRTPPYARRRGLDFEKSFQADAYPSQKSKRESLGPAGFFQARAKAAELFETGGEVSGRRYLAIPLPAARRLKLDYAALTRGNTGTFGKRTNIDAINDRFGPLHILPTSGGGFILAADAKRAAKEGLKPKGKKAYVPLVLMTPRVTVPDKLDFFGTADRWAGRLDSLIERRFNRGA